MSKAIGERLADSKSTKQQMEEGRERYRPLAVRGSLLYFTVAELCRVDVMYQYSLDYFQVKLHRVPVYARLSAMGQWATLAQQPRTQKKYYLITALQQAGGTTPPSFLAYITSFQRRKWTRQHITRTMPFRRP